MSKFIQIPGIYDATSSTTQVQNDMILQIIANLEYADDKSTDQGTPSQNQFTTYPKNNVASKAQASCWND